MASVSPYKKLINRLKRLAPKVPDYTCPDIDFVIDKIETNKGFTRFRKKLLVRKLERLRQQNDDMRELGKFWFKKFKDYMREYLD
jgi:hypothetical protein